MNRISKSFDEFTVKQFKDWHKIVNTKFDDPLDKEYSFLALCLGITLEQALNIPNKQALPMLAKLNTLSASKPTGKVKNIIAVNGKIYEAILKPSELKALLSANQYTAFKEYTKKDCIENMDKILSLLYCPYHMFKKKKLHDNQEWLSEQMLNAKIKDVYGAVFFYSIVFPRLSEASLPYLKKAAQTIQDHMEQIQKEYGKDSEKAMAGTI